MTQEYFPVVLKVEKFPEDYRRITIVKDGGQPFPNSGKASQAALVLLGEELTARKEQPAPQLVAAVVSLGSQLTIGDQKPNVIVYKGRVALCHEL